MLAAIISSRHCTAWYVLSCKGLSQLLTWSLWGRGTVGEGDCGGRGAVVEGACAGGKRCNVGIIAVEEVNIYHAHFSP